MIVFHSLGQLGRLGNQLFQIAACLSHAKKVGEEAVFNSWPYRDYFERKITCRTDLGCMEINGIRHEMVHQPQIHYVPIPQNKNLILNGWFQSWKYIDEELIKDYFHPNPALVSNIAILLNYNPDIAIHVRRDDYLLKPEYHNPLTMDYYKNALLLMLAGRDIAKLNVTIFSDDIPWCRQEFPKLNIPINFNYSQRRSDIVDLYFMAEHKHQIIANSSFSWWGAWLHRVMNYSYDDQMVIAPKQWFGKAVEHDTKDIYCPGWITL